MRESTIPYLPLPCFAEYLIFCVKGQLVWFDFAFLHPQSETVTLVGFFFSFLTKGLIGFEVFKPVLYKE